MLVLPLDPPTPDPLLAEDLERRYAGATAEAILDAALAAFHPRLAFACSLGLEDAALLDLIALREPRPRIFFLGTGRLQQVWAYVRDHAVPYNRLHDQGYPSIGCAPCTRAVQPGADPRSGRGWWERPDHRECGLHKAEP
jgi:3'-phosphoadenosine 5'-phosphosulfate sulfotransferase (PAPS reductase)/FAD synthetase